MRKILLSLWEKYQDIVPYAVFGVLTTIVNIAVYWFAAHLLTLSVMLSTVLAWIAAVLFAYITNRKWVFHSQAEMPDEILKEILSFFACRLATRRGRLGVYVHFCGFTTLERCDYKSGRQCFSNRFELYC